MNLSKPKRKVDNKLLKAIRKMPCACCGRNPPSDPSHIRSVGSGGPDEPWNVVPMNRDCHRTWHSVGAKTFCERHPEFRALLEYMGWEISEKLTHPKLRAA